MACSDNQGFVTLIVFKSSIPVSRPVNRNPAANNNDQNKQHKGALCNLTLILLMRDDFAEGFLHFRDVVIHSAYILLPYQRPR